MLGELVNQRILDDTLNIIDFFFKTYLIHFLVSFLLNLAGFWSLNEVMEICAYKCKLAMGRRLLLQIYTYSYIYPQQINGF